MKMLKTVLLYLVALHVVIGQVRKPHPKIGKVTCRDLRPQGDTHNRGVEDPSDFYQQYDIKMNNTRTNAWDIVLITISGKNDNTLRGFIVQVRSEGSTDPIGVFIVYPIDPLVATIDCGDETEKDTAVLKFPEPPKEYVDFNKVTMTWSPNGFRGKVQVFATVVKRGNIFWVARNSSDLMVY